MRGKEEIKKTIEESSELKKQVSEFLKEKAVELKKRLIDEAPEKLGVKVIVFRGGGSSEIMKDVAFQIRGEVKGKFLFVAGVDEGAKCQLQVMISDELVAEGLDASKLIKSGAQFIKGGGGGQPHYATAGGKDVNGLADAVNAIVEAAGLN